METVTILGIAAGTLTTGSLLPQVLKAWKTRHTKDLSLVMFLLLFTGVGLWFLYGVAINDFPVMLANFVSLVLILAILSFKLRYG
ncbi:MAG: SemiSWEET family sugar transporter [Thermodesulfobacteriota bacterium]